MAYIPTSWTQEEVRVWAQAGLIPNELLTPGNHLELMAYIYKNQEKLFSYYRKNPEDSDLQITMPSPDKLSTAYEIPILNRKTGKIVDAFHMVTSFELCEDVFIKIRAQELETWKKETAGARELNKTQGEEFKATILEIASKGSLSREEIVTVLEEVRKKRKTTKVRHGGHYVDNKLNDKQTTFDELLPSTRDEIEASNITVPGIRFKLTPAEDKLINAIYNLLHQKSENKNTKSEFFYGGNIQGQLVDYGPQKAMAVRLKIRPAELYKEFTGTDLYSGKDIINIKNTLYGLTKKQHLIRYDRHRNEKRGRKTVKVIDRIEYLQSLIQIAKWYEGMTDKEVKNLDAGDQTIREQKEELILVLHPLFTDQIDDKYVEYPSDISQRTAIACGGPMSVTASVIALRDYLLREISAKRDTSTLNEENLISKLGLTSYKESGRKKLLDTRIKEAIEACTKLGIIIDTKIETGAQDQIKYTFTINSDFE